MNKRIRNTLVQARDLISDSKKWTQGGFARDKTGKLLCASEIEYAYCWCALGAIYKVTPVGRLRTATATALEQVMGGPIGPFNDSATHEDVLAAFDIAICLES